MEDNWFFFQCARKLQPPISVLALSHEFATLVNRPDPICDRIIKFFTEKIDRNSGVSSNLGAIKITVGFFFFTTGFGRIRTAVNS